MEGEGERCARFGSDASVMERGGGRIMRGRGVAGRILLWRWENFLRIIIEMAGKFCWEIIKN